MRPALYRCAALGLIAFVPACATTDPLLNQNNWRPIGVNEQNIAAQVVNPNDLVSGRGASGSDGATAAAAVMRLRTDHVKPLQDSALTDLKVQSAPSSSSSP